MIIEVSGKILDSFATCLASKLDTRNDEPAAVTPAAETAAAPADAEEAAEPPAKPKPTRRRTTAAKAAPQASVSAEVAEPAAKAEPAAEPAPHLQLVDEPAAAPEPAKQARQVNVTSEADAIDLLDYAGPSVAKRLIPVLAGVLGVVLLVWRLRRRGR
jgi:hypothetical protein